MFTHLNKASSKERKNTVFANKSTTKNHSKITKDIVHLIHPFFSKSLSVENPCKVDWKSVYMVSI